MPIDINNIEQAPQFLEDVHDAKRIGNTQIMIAQTLGGRMTQEDEFFATTALPKNSEEWPVFLKDAFKKASQEIIVNGSSGSTATIAVISANNKLTFAHVGDSPAVLFVRDQHTGSVTAHELLTLHNGKNAAERKRVEKDGGSFYGDRVEGGSRIISVTRRLGNNSLYPGLTSDPEITSVDLARFSKPGDQLFLCISSDGLYGEESLKAADYATIIEQAYRNGRKNDIPNLMMDYATQQGSKDNMTVLFTELPGNRSHDIVMGVCDGHTGNITAQTAKSSFEKTLSAEMAASRPMMRPGSDDDTKTWVR